MTERETNWLNLSILLINVVLAALLVFLGNLMLHERTDTAAQRKEAQESFALERKAHQEYTAAERKALHDEAAAEREKARSDERRSVRQLNKLLKWNEEVQAERHKTEVKKQITQEHGE